MTPHTNHRHVPSSRLTGLLASLALACGAGAPGCADDHDVPRACASDEECESGEACVLAGAFASGTTCEPGCRSDADCEAGAHCSSDRLCGSGCDADEHCAAVEYCHFDFVIGLGRTGPSGDCRPGCRDDAGCGAGETCLCNVCVDSCRSDTDCSEGSYCAGLGAFSCEVPRCEVLPGPVTCRDQVCAPRAASYPFGRSALAPCCTAEGACGLDVGVVAGIASQCQAPGQVGEDSTGCPDGWDVFGVTYPGCLRPDGQCGVNIDAVRDAGIGCASGARPSAGTP